MQEIQIHSNQMQMEQNYHLQNNGLNNQMNSPLNTTLNNTLQNSLNNQINTNSNNQLQTSNSTTINVQSGLKTPLTKISWNSVDSEKIATDVKYYHVSEDGKTIIYVQSDNEIARNFSK